MQELVIDLLAVSRFAQNWSEEPAETESQSTAQVSGAMRFALNIPANGAAAVGTLEKSN
jgi:hypothetical protein